VLFRGGRSIGLHDVTAGDLSCRISDRTETTLIFGQHHHRGPRDCRPGAPCAVSTPREVSRHDRRRRGSPSGSDSGDDTDPWRSGQRSSVDARMTTDTVNDVRSIGSGCGSPAAVSDGGNSNAGSPPLALLVALVNARRHGARPPSYDSRNGRSKWVEYWAHLSRAAWPGCCGGSRKGPQAAASPGWPPAMDVVAAR
jgi:hypothetical protein